MFFIGKNGILKPLGIRRKIFGLRKGSVNLEQILDLFLVFLLLNMHW